MITSPQDNIILNNASYDSFVCDPSNPFDSSNVDHRIGYFVQFFADGAVAPVVSSITMDTAPGNDVLTGERVNGEMKIRNISALEMSAGFCIIYFRGIN